MNNFALIARNLAFLLHDWNFYLLFGLSAAPCFDLSRCNIGDISTCVSYSRSDYASIAGKYDLMMVFLIWYFPSKTNSVTP